LVRIDVGESKGRVECIGVELRAFREKSDGGWPPELPEWNQNPTPLLRRTLRDLPLGQILEDIGAEVQQAQLDLATLFRAEGLPPTEDDEEFRAIADGIEASVKRQRATGRKRGRGVPDLEAIAHVYRDAQARRRSTTKAIAKWGQVSDSTAAKWVMRVRKETDLLPAPTNAPRQPRGRRS